MATKTELLNKSDPQRNAANSSRRSAGPLLTGKATLHRLGVVVASISAVAEFAASMSAAARTAGFLIVSTPKPAAAFRGRTIAWGTPRVDY